MMRWIRAHPDLVGRLAKEGRLTGESTREQAAAGLGRVRRERLAAQPPYAPYLMLSFCSKFLSPICRSLRTMSNCLSRRSASAASAANASVM